MCCVVDGWYVVLCIGVVDYCVWFKDLLVFGVLYVVELLFDGDFGVCVYVVCWLWCVMNGCVLGFVFY